MNLAWVNRFPDMTITAQASTVGDLPAENAQLMPVAKVARFDGTSGYIEFDAGSAVTIDVVSLQRTNLVSTATWRVRLSNTSAAAGDLLDTSSIGVSTRTGYLHTYYVIASTITARYGRIDISGPTNPEIGFVFMGPMWTPVYGQSYGENIRWDDPSDVAESLGGQDIVFERPRRRIADFTLNEVPVSTAISQLMELDRLNGTNSNVLVMLDPSNYPLEKSLMGRIIRSTDLTHWTFDTVRKLFSVKERQ